VAHLADRHKRLIVQRLATFTSTTEILAELQEHGVAATHAQIAFYNPDLASSVDVAAKWRTLHAETRAAFIRDTSAIPITHKAYRLRELNDMAKQARTKKNYPLAAQLLEQAAKEMGESYTNRRVIEPADPAAALASTLGVSLDEISAALAGLSGS